MGNGPNENSFTFKKILSSIMSLSRLESFSIKAWTYSHLMQWQHVKFSRSNISLKKKNMLWNEMHDIIFTATE